MSIIEVNALISNRLKASASLCGPSSGFHSSRYFANDLEYWMPMIRAFFLGGLVGRLEDRRRCGIGGIVDRLVEVSSEKERRRQSSGGMSLMGCVDGLKQGLMYICISALSGVLG